MNEFKQTGIGIIPEDWNVVRRGCEINRKRYLLKGEFL